MAHLKIQFGKSDAIFVLLKDFKANGVFQSIKPLTNGTGAGGKIVCMTSGMQRFCEKNNGIRPKHSVTYKAICHYPSLYLSLYLSLFIEYMQNKTLIKEVKKYKIKKTAKVTDSDR